jgi:chemotaxis protein MotB
MARISQLISLAAVGFTLVGCVSQEKYNALKMDRDRYAEQLGQAQNEASTSKAEAEAYKNQIGQIAGNKDAGGAMVLNLTTQNAELQRQLDEIKHRYDEAIRNAGAGTVALPQEVTNELSDFARQKPDLVDFDSARGIVKFKSDLTFSPGSAELTGQARGAIVRFAQILNSPAANGYELIVAGHTDNTRVINPQTKAQGHKDNWYLSAHRAIAVGEELQQQRVNPQRIAVTGYADQRPIASNASESGKAQNRRVEVLILPTTVKSGSLAATPVAPARSAPRPRLNKDSATPAAAHARPNKDTTPAANTDVRPAVPVLNK